MPRKRTHLGDEPEPAAPTDIPDRKPRGRRSCEACAVVGPEATVQLCLRRTGKPQGKFLGNATDVCQLMRGLEDADRESFYALHMNVRHHIVDIDKVAVGSQSSVEVHPREVFKSALLSGADSLIFVHNHPSGNAAPSLQDQELTGRLRDVGKLVGIPVLDHIIVGGTGCNSMASRGLLGEAHTATYTPLADKAPKKK
jgi:DNA repair protein RadC